MLPFPSLTVLNDPVLQQRLAQLHRLLSALRFPLLNQPVDHLAAQERPLVLDRVLLPHLQDGALGTDQPGGGGTRRRDAARPCHHTQPAEAGMRATGKALQPKTSLLGGVGKGRGKAELQSGNFVNPQRRGGGRFKEISSAEASAKAYGES